MDSNISKPFLQSYLYVENEKKYFVSTIYRRSSAQLNPDQWYYETLAWSLEGDIRKSLVEDNSGALSPIGAFKQHQEVLLKLWEEFKT